MAEDECKKAAELIACLNDGQKRFSLLHLLANQDIATVLNKADGAYLTAQEISQKTPNKLNPLRLERMMRYGATIGVVKESSRGGVPEFAKTLASDMIRKSDEAMNHRYETLWDNEMMKAVRKVEEATLEENSEKLPFVMAHGKHVFPYLMESPKKMETFQGAMTARSSRDLLELIPYLMKLREDKDGVRFLDVGGGHGGVMRKLKQTAPQIHCSVLELPDVVERVVDAGGVEFVAGDMFDKNTIPEADYVFMKHIVHDWSDENCHKILTNIHDRISDGGSVCIVEGYIPDAGKSNQDDWAAFALDILMMTIGGRERTESEMKEMLSKAGFKVVDTMVWEVPFHGKQCCTVARKV